MAANQAAEILGVNVIPFDRDGREEFYERTRFLPRQKAAGERLKDWLRLQAKKDTNSVQVLLGQLLSEAETRQAHLNAEGTLKGINSPAYDMIINLKHSLMSDVLPNAIEASGDGTLAGEFRFLADEWQERNRIMARNIQDIARSFPAKRLVVLTGTEHRYILRDLLRNASGLELKEFYEVPG